MTSPVVEQLMNGIRLRWPDGSEAICKPPSLRFSIEIDLLWKRWMNPQMAELQQQVERMTSALKPGDPEPPDFRDLLKRLADIAVDASEAHQEIRAKFAATYPELAEPQEGRATYLSPGDVDVLLPSFFGSLTGVSVIRPKAADGNGTTPSTGHGTMPSESTSPPASASPT